LPIRKRAVITAAVAKRTKNPSETNERGLYRLTDNA